jgi:hypothetical protein
MGENSSRHGGYEVVSTRTRTRTASLTRLRNNYHRPAGPASTMMRDIPYDRTFSNPLSFQQPNFFLCYTEN